MLLSLRSFAPATWLLLASPALALLPGAAFSDAGAGGTGSSTPQAMAEPATHAYWLRNSTLLDESAKPVGTVRASQLVRIDAVSRARSLPGAAQVIDGYLPASLFIAPKDGEGLALYAQRQADLRDESGNGSVIGRIYPGAFVSVVPAGPGYLKIALPAFPAASAARNQIVAIVERPRSARRRNPSKVLHKKGV